MRVAGPNIYRVHYRFNNEKLKDQEFQTLVIAHSEKEAIAHVGDNVVKVTLVDSDISIIIPDQYVINQQGRQAL